MTNQEHWMRYGYSKNWTRGNSRNGRARKDERRAEAMKRSPMSVNQNKQRAVLEGVA